MENQNFNNAIPPLEEKQPLNPNSENLNTTTESVPEIDPIYQNNNQYTQPIPRENRYSNQQSEPPKYYHSNEYYNYRNANNNGYNQNPNSNYYQTGGNQQNQPSNPHYTTTANGFQSNTSKPVKSQKPNKKGKFFKGFAAVLAIIVALYGSFLLGSYQSEQNINNKLADIRQELQHNQTDKSASTVSAIGANTTVSPVVTIAENVSPSVVTITSVVTSRANNIFFEPSTYRSSGSGILYKIIDKKLYIITNHHVIEGGSDIQVNFYNGETANAEVVGYDSRNDLAVLKVNLSDLENQDVKLANFGDSTKLKVGQLAVAIGNPLGQGHDHTITSGVISSVNRTLNIENIKNLEVIQTDAAINPGNSGGALVNEFSEVIGINTAKYSDVKVEGMGFAIPSSVAIPVVEKILKNGNGDAAYALSDDRPFLGIGFSNITSEIYSETGVPFGVAVNKVYKGGAAAKAGVKVNDVIFSIDGTKVKDTNMLFDVIGKLNVGDKIHIGIVRGEKILDLEATITSYGEVKDSINKQPQQR